MNDETPAVLKVELAGRGGKIEAKIGDRFKRGFEEWEIVAWGDEYPTPALNGLMQQCVRCKWCGEGPPPSYFQRYMNGPILEFCADAVAEYLIEQRDAAS